MIGINMSQQNPDHARPIEYEDIEHRVKACYFPGSGLGGTFLEYIFNGATGSDIGKDCIETYKYIVKHYSEDYEVWMFGLSRGAYTVRCVAGMINNCGILKRMDGGGSLDDHLIDGLCDEVYKIYRSPYPEDHPKSDRSRNFRDRASYLVPTPIKFMGLFDTVGSLGVPKLDAGIGLNFPEFYDQKISGVVEKVYHACAIHDRLWGFEPCHAMRGKRTQNANDEAVREATSQNRTDEPKLEIHERWFPGCHYDLGRQRFRFLRNGANWIERVISQVLDPLSNVIKPNEVLADLVLKYMLESIKEQDPQGIVIQGIDVKINNLIHNMTNATHQNAGSGDIYGKILDYGPAGKLWQVLDHIFTNLTPSAFQDSLGLKLIINVLAETRDRRIPDPKAVLTLYKDGSRELNERTITDLAWINLKRYPSQTYENFRTYLTVLDTAVSVESMAS
ncbi:hypothetical protein CPB97_002717 [Podila verticillata]|nr:hypothetical protein CPB97_002717 [Podila verticillata]